MGQTALVLAVTACYRSHPFQSRSSAVDRPDRPECSFRRARIGDTGVSYEIETGATMDRAHRATSVKLSCLAVMLLATGCSLVPTIAYIIKPEDTPAEFDGLSGKRVAVICRATSLGYAQPTVGRDVAVQVGALLAKNGHKIQIVDQRELADWVDKHDWQDYREVGKALKADMVVGIDLDRFETSRGSTLLQGQADVRLSVHDIKKNLAVWEKSPATITTPPNMHDSGSSSHEEEFRRRFIGMLSERIAHHFYDYDSRKHFATGGDALN